MTCCRLFFSVKPFPSGGPFSITVPKVAAVAAITTTATPAPAWLGRSIATPQLRILEHSAFVDQQRDQDSYHKHLFVHIGGSPDYSDPLLEVYWGTSFIYFINLKLNKR